MATLSRLAPEVPVTDMSASLEYYREQLGFELSTLMPDGNYAIVERDGIALHLFVNNEEKHSPLGAHIFTADLDEIFEELRDRGAHIAQAIARKPWGNREFRVKDNAGNEFKFTEPSPE